MGWPKGTSGNPSGRPRGIVDARTREKATMTAIIDHLPAIAEALALTRPRFALFSGFEHATRGGYHDYQDAFVTLDDAQKAGRSILNHAHVLGWFHIVDVMSGEIVAREDNRWERDDEIYYDDEDDL